MSKVQRCGPGPMNYQGVQWLHTQLPHPEWVQVKSDAEYSCNSFYMSSFLTLSRLLSKDHWWEKSEHKMLQRFIFCFSTDLSGFLHILGRAPKLVAKVFLISNTLLFNKKVPAIVGLSGKSHSNLRGFQLMAAPWRWTSHPCRGECQRHMIQVVEQHLLN